MSLENILKKTSLIIVKEFPPLLIFPEEKMKLRMVLVLGKLFFISNSRKGENPKTKPAPTASRFFITAARDFGRNPLEKIPEIRI